MTTPTPEIELPRGAQGGVALCHTCQTWRAAETVRDVPGPDGRPVQLCEECSLLPDAPRPPAKPKAAKKPAKKATPRKRTDKAVK